MIQYLNLNKTNKNRSKKDTYNDSKDNQTLGNLISVVHALIKLITGTSHFI